MATDSVAPNAGTLKAWVTTITPKQMNGLMGWWHRIRLGFFPSKRIPTPHWRNGKLDFSIEDSFIELQIPINSIKKAPWWKAPFGGQEYVPSDILVSPASKIGGLK